MRRSFAAMLPLCVALVTIARGDQTFPYTAYVTADDVYVRSGPGKDYYPTGKLKEGQAVEVYRHDPGGWYAIRPPKDSFTWVSSRYLRPTGNGLAEVTSVKVAARVGSQFSDIRDVIQVRLHEGELVEPAEPGAVVGTANEQAWVKIRPPSGEFRWVYGKFVDADYAVDGVRKTPPGVESHRISDNEPPWAPPERAEPISREAARVTLPAEALPPPSAPRTLTPEEFKKRVEAVDLDLSIMVAEEPTVWSFDQLTFEAESLLAQAETAVERGRARLLLNKIDRFANIQQRYQAVNSSMAATERRDEQLASLRGEAHAARSTDDRYDGRGRLTRVVSPKAGAPRYALVDESGKVRCYVTPAPGVNLRHYEQRWVGVTGTRGFMPEQQTPHVMAKHVNEVESSMLR